VGGINNFRWFPSPCFHPETKLTLEKEPPDNPGGFYLVGLFDEKERGPCRPPGGMGRGKRPTYGTVNYVFGNGSPGNALSECQESQHRNKHRQPDNFNKVLLDAFLLFHNQLPLVKTAVPVKLLVRYSVFHAPEAAVKLIKMPLQTLQGHMARCGI
jgi:hypothetical protein